MTQNSTSASAEPQPRKFADPDTDASKLFQAFHVLAVEGKRVNNYRVGDAVVSAYVDKYSIFCAAPDRVAGFSVTFEIKTHGDTVRALLRCAVPAFRDTTLIIDSSDTRIPTLIKDGDVHSASLKDALEAVVRACGLTPGAASEVFRFSSESINDFAYGFLRSALQDEDAENRAAAAGKEPADCDDATWKLARRIAVRFFNHIAKPLVVLKEMCRTHGEVCDLPAWRSFGSRFYWYGIRGNDDFDLLEMRTTPRGLERFTRACNLAADAIISGDARSVFSLVRGQVHLDIRGPVHASAEPVTDGQHSPTLDDLKQMLERRPEKKLTVRSNNDVVTMCIPERKLHTIDGIRVYVTNTKWNKDVLDTAIFNIAHLSDPGIYLWDPNRASARRLSDYHYSGRHVRNMREFTAGLVADAIEAGDVRYLALCAKLGVPAEAAAEPQTDVKESEFEPRATIFNAFYPLVEMRTKTKSVSVKIPSGSVAFKVNPKSIESWHNVDDVSMYEVDGVVSAHGETILLKVRTTKVPHQTTDVIVDTEGERIPVVLRNNEMRLTGNKATDLKAVISLVLRRCGLLEGAKSHIPGEHVEHDTRGFVEGFLDVLLNDIGDRSHKDYDEDNDEPKLSERFSTHDFDSASIELVRKIAERFFRHIARARRAYTRAAPDVKPVHYGAFFYFQAFGDGVGFGDMPHKSSTDAWDYLVDVCVQASRAIVQGGSVEGADVDLVGRKLHLKFAHGTSIHAAAEPQPGLVKFTEPEDVAEALRKHMRLAAPFQNQFGDLHVRISPEIELSVVVSSRGGIGVILRFLGIAAFATRVSRRKPEKLLEYVKAAVVRLAKYASDMRKLDTFEEVVDFEAKLHNEMHSFPKNEITKPYNVSGVYSIPSQVAQRVRGPNTMAPLRKWFNGVKQAATAAAEPQSNVHDSWRRLRESMRRTRRKQFTFGTRPMEIVLRTDEDDAQVYWLRCTDNSAKSLARTDAVLYVVRINVGTDGLLVAVGSGMFERREGSVTNVINDALRELDKFVNDYMRKSLRDGFVMRENGYDVQAKKVTAKSVVFSITWTGKNAGRRQLPDFVYDRERVQTLYWVYGSTVWMAEIAKECAVFVAQHADTAHAAAEPQAESWAYIVLEIPGVGSNTNDTNYQALLDLDEFATRGKVPFFSGVGISSHVRLVRRVLAFRNLGECTAYMRTLYKAAKSAGATDEFLSAFKPSDGLTVHRQHGNDMSTVLGLVHRYGFAGRPFVGAAAEPVPKGGSDLSHLFSEAVRKAAAGNLSFSIGEHKVRVVVPDPGRIADASAHHQPSICFEVRNHIVGKASEVDAQLVRARDAVEVVVHRVSERRREFPRNREIGSLIPSREAAATITHRDLRTDAKPVDLLKRIIDEFKELCALDPIRAASLIDYDVRDEYFDWYAKLTTRYGQVGALVPGFQARRDERHIVLRHTSGTPEIAVYPLDGLTGIYEDTETRKLAFKIPLSDLESVSAIKSALASKLQECLAARRAAGNS